MTEEQYERAIKEIEEDYENGKITYAQYRMYIRELDEEYEGEY